MSINQTLTPMQMANKLRCLYQSKAINQAAVEAHEAVENNDIQDCLYWRQVFKILVCKTL